MKMIPHNRVYIITLTVTLVTGQLITYENGKLGVNFLGFHAAVGIGGLLNGDLARGGLHAEAGTPFGQFAQAGLKGETGEDGKMYGRLYSGATAGNGISATAGLQGALDGSGGVGQAAAGTSLFGRTSGIETKVVQPAFDQSGSSSNQDEREITMPRFTRESGSEDEKDKKDEGEQVNETTKKPESNPDSSIYIVKNKKKLTKYAQTHYDAVHKGVIRPLNVTYIEKNISPSASTVNTQISDQPPQGGLLSTLLGSLANRNTRDSTNNNDNNDNREDSSDKNDNKDTSSTTQSPYYYKKIIRFTHGNGNSNANGNKSGSNLFDDIFNIPISTLQAVNRLVNNIVGGVGGSVSVSKHVN